MPDPYWENIGKEAEKSRNARYLGASHEQGSGSHQNPQGRKSKVGRKLWICQSCKAESWEHWTALNRAARMRCPSCGSMQYEPKTQEAKEDMADLREVRKNVKGEKGEGEGTFVLGGND